MSIFISSKDKHSNSNLVNDAVDLCISKINNTNLFTDSYSNTQDIIEQKEIHVNSCEICKRQCNEIFELVKVLNKKINDMTLVYQENSELVRRISKLERKVMNMEAKKKVNLRHK